MLFGFAMRRMLAAFAAELFELQPLSRLLLILCREVIAIFAVCALKNDFISHNDFSTKPKERDWILLSSFQNKFRL